MRTKLFVVVFFLTAIASALVSCNNECDVSPTPVTLDLSNSDPRLPNGQVVTPEFKLGKVLFYDSHLSVNASISCASCHKQALAFSDNTALSRGFENRLTLRNSQPIQNLGFFGNPSVLSLFWDGRESFLQTMVLKPILNHVEMGMGTEAEIVERVSRYPYYADLFMEAYGTSTVTSERISGALTIFIENISSTNSRFDRWQRNEGQLSAIELSGKSLFFTKYNCNGCHKVDMPGLYHTTDAGFINIGLDADYADNGRYNVTNNPHDRGGFKVPELRNVAITAPYMHDGRFATLDQVLDHYSHGIANHPNLDFRLRNSEGNAASMNISDQEKSAIIAFLNTMTDYSMISCKSFSDPFVH